MKQCTGCESEIAAEAKTCPHCRADQRGWSGRRRKLIATTFLLCMPLLGLAGALFLHAGLWVPYYNCGEIEVSSGEINGWIPSTDADVRRWRGGQMCLWEHYRQGQRVMLTSEDRERDLLSVVFKVEPADLDAPIHVQIAGETATCRAMLNTGSGLRIEGCTWTPLALPPSPSAFTLCWNARFYCSDFAGLLLSVSNPANFDHRPTY